MKFAVIKTGGKQYKVQEGDKVKIEKLELSEGAEVKFSDVLLISDEVGNDIKIGNPFIKSAEVEGRVLKQGRDDKIIVFKYKSKKRYQKKAGHRQRFSEVEIVKIKTA